MASAECGRRRRLAAIGLAAVFGTILPQPAAPQSASDAALVGWGQDWGPLHPDVRGLSQVAAGDQFAVALRHDGTVVAWGHDYYGQATVPAGLSEVVAVAAGNGHSLALKADGTVAAWGNPYGGQTRVPAGLSGVVAVAGGSEHSLAVKSDGTVVAWGGSGFGQATVPAGLSGVVGVAAGLYHSLAVKSDGTVVAWGRKDEGQVTVPAGLSGVVSVAAGAYHSVALKSDGTVAVWGQAYYGQTAVPAGLSGVIAVAAGWTHTLALKSDGTVVSWGWMTDGAVPPGLTGVVSIAAGSSLNVALKSDGSIVSWGAIKRPPPDLAQLAEVSAGFFHALALRTDGSVVAWGLGGSGATTVPPGLSGVTSVSAGGYHNLALKSDGTVVAWGRNTERQATVPPGLSGVVSVRAGAYHSLAVKADGTVVAWGYNGYGQATVPAGLSGIVSVAAGFLHSLAVKSDGTVVGWGGNFYGEATVPADLAGAVSAAAGAYHSVVLKSDGTVVAWGLDANGQTTVPTGLSGVVAVAAGSNHNVALKSDGTVIAWGDDTKRQATVPAGLTGIVGIAAGGDSSLAFRVPPAFVLTVGTAGSGAGTIGGPGMSCSTGSPSSSCSAIYPENERVGLTATASAGSTFSGWSGACSGTGPCTVTMDAPRSVTATFGAENPVGPTYTLTAQTSGTGSGTIGGGYGMSCGSPSSGSCTASVPATSPATAATLTATPAGGSFVSRWTGCDAVSPDQATCTVTLAGARTVTAHFEAITFPLAVRTNGAGSGTVATTETDPAISCTGNAGACSGAAPNGATVTLVATPAAGSQVVDWYGCANVSADKRTCTAQVTKALTVAAIFQPATYLLTVTGTGSGTIATAATDPDLSCTGNAGQCAGAAPYGSLVTLSATPAPGWLVSSWSGCTSVSADKGTCTVSMTYARGVSATFQPSTYLLTARTSGSGSGTVATTGTDPDLSCAGNAGQCSGSAPNGSTVTLGATPASGSLVSSWSGCTSVSADKSTCTVSMTYARTVTATFLPATYLLTARTSGLGSGTVATTGTDPDLSCTGNAGQCSGSAPNGSTVILGATPASGSLVSSWSGCTSVSADKSTCTVAMASARTVTATFQPTTYLLTARTSGFGSGTVATTGTDPGISCTGNVGACAGSAANGATVTLTASPAPGSLVSEWSGCPQVSPDRSTCTVAMTGARTVTASFQPAAYPLKVRTAGTGQGEVATTDTEPGILCAANAGQCTGSAANGSTVTLTATPASGSYVSGWSGCATVSADRRTCTVEMTGAQSATASFETGPAP